MIIRTVNVKTILTPSKVYPYVINPYIGCEFGCIYCYACFMKKFTGHRDPWGQFVDVKINAATLLQKEIAKKQKDQVWLSGVCDPYQPSEKRYKLTRSCLKLLVENDWPVVIQTKSDLVLRDMDIIKQSQSCEVGFTITTVNDSIRKLFEPKAPPVTERIRALHTLKNAGITTYAMIAPMLPDCEKLIDLLEGCVDYIYIDRMNYYYAHSVYKKHKLESYCTNQYFFSASNEIAEKCKKAGIVYYSCF